MTPPLIGSAASEHAGPHRGRSLPCGAQRPGGEGRRNSCCGESAAAGSAVDATAGNGGGVSGVEAWNPRTRAGLVFHGGQAEAAARGSRLVATSPPSRPQPPAAPTPLSASTCPRLVPSLRLPPVAFPRIEITLPAEHAIAAAAPVDLDRFGAATACDWPPRSCFRHHLRRYPEKSVRFHQQRRQDCLSACLGDLR